jgi:hypothetical protein
VIRRLIAYLRGTRQPTTAPSEPHSHGGFDSEPTAFGRSRTTNGTPLTAEPTAFDRLILGPDDGAAGRCDCHTATCANGCTTCHDWDDDDGQVLEAEVPGELLLVPDPHRWRRAFGRLWGSRPSVEPDYEAWVSSMRDDRCAEDIGWDLVVRDAGRRMDQAAFAARWAIAEAVDRFKHGERVTV